MVRSRGTVRTQGQRPRLPRLVAIALIGGLALAAATSAGGQTGPATVSIPSVGGYNLCLDNILNADTIHRVNSVQGTRHPYRVAAYSSAETLLGLSGQISVDTVYYWDENVHLGGASVKRMRIDNQAAASGNGLYKCESKSV